MGALKGRIIINADILLKTGMHIGAGNNSIEIGGIDSSVVKTYKGEPYIPGSSIKGKLRSLTEIAEGRINISENNRGNIKGDLCQCGKCPVCKIYGVSANNNEEGLPTRIIVRDAFLKEEIRDDMKNKKNGFENLEFTYTESKWENTIDRVTSTANPRVIERVPEGTIFELQIVYTVYNDEDLDNFKYIIDGLEYLQDDYLGGNGSRGYGQVEFKNIKVISKTIKDYKNEKLDEFENLENIQSADIEKIKTEFKIQ